MERWPQYRTGEAGLQAALGPLELKVLESVWALGEATVGDVVERTGTEDSYTTVKTVMERLAKKGLLSRRREGRAYLYRPTLSREELEARVARRVVDSLLAGFGSTALTQFARVVGQDAKRLEELRALLRELSES